VIGEVDGRTAWSLHASEARLIPGAAATLMDVSVRLPHGLVAAGAAALIGLAAAGAGAAAAGRPAKTVAKPSAAAAAAPVAPAAAAGTAAPAAPGPPMEIAADRLEVDRKAGRATFSGAVVATRGELKLTCDHLVADYDPEGALRSVVADGHVALASGRLHATATRADYREAEAAVLLEGDLKVTDGKSTLTGERARILLDEERFVVEKARGRLVFAAPAAASAKPPAAAPAPPRPD